jgi:hypothetical protein
LLLARIASADFLLISAHVRLRMTCPDCGNKKSLHGVIHAGFFL